MWFKNRIQVIFAEHNANSQLHFPLSVSSFDDDVHVRRLVFLWAFSERKKGQHNTLVLSLRRIQSSAQIHVSAAKSTYCLDRQQQNHWTIILMRLADYILRSISTPIDWIDVNTIEIQFNAIRSENLLRIEKQKKKNVQVNKVINREICNEHFNRGRSAPHAEKKTTRFFK